MMHERGGRGMFLKEQTVANELLRHVERIPIFSFRAAARTRTYFSSSTGIQGFFLLLSVSSFCHRAGPRLHDGEWDSALILYIQDDLFQETQPRKNDKMLNYYVIAQSRNIHVRL